MHLLLTTLICIFHIKLFSFLDNQTDQSALVITVSVPKQPESHQFN